MKNNIIKINVFRKLFFIILIIIIYNDNYFKENDFTELEQYFKSNSSKIPNDFIEALYRTNETNQKVILFNNIYIKFIKAIYIDKKKIFPISEFVFYEPGEHQVIISLYINKMNTSQLFFYNIEELISISFQTELLNSNIISFHGIFKNCVNLKYANINTILGSKSLDFSSAFQNCKSLNSLNLSNIISNYTINISYLFANCTSLKYIDLSNFNTESIKDMSGLFYNCYSLESINLTSFNTQNVLSMKYMFAGCNALSFIDLHFFNFSNTRDINYMFKSCIKLTSVIFPNFEMNKIVNKKGLFDGCDVFQKKYDFCIVGSWFAKNYGCMATYYALHQTLKNLGFSLLMLDNPNVKFRKYSKDKCDPITIARNLYNVSKPIKYNKLYELNNDCRGFIVGSDQIWRPAISRHFKQFFFLDFADDKIKKISYGTSFGAPFEGTIEEKKRLQINLKRFNELSVRDRLSMNITKKILGINNVTQVCDPTFICDFSEYQKLINKSKVKENFEFILAYILDPTSEKGQRLEKLSIDKNISVLIILDENQSIWKKNRKRLNLTGIGNIIVKEKVDLNDFMWYYYHSKAVFTDSFHGTIFSIIFKKPFVSLINIERGGERFFSLLEPINLLDRLFENVSCINERYELYDRLDYKIPYEKLSKIKEFSFNWLQNALKY